MSNQPRVTELWIYPIKSCRGISVSELEIDEFGPKYDRQWMIVDETNKFITLRNQSKLALIKTEIDAENLILSFDSKTIILDLVSECQTVETVTVWSDSFLAGVESSEINAMLSEFLEQNVKLVRYQKESFRDLKAAGSSVVKQTRFADARPLLLTNTASLDDLNQKLQEKGLPQTNLERFRSNIIIEGLPAFVEDNFQQMTVGTVALVNPKLCARCVVITQDENTGKVISKETLATLAEYRRQGGNKVMFGVNWTPENTGTIRIGDLVTNAH